MPPGGHVGNKYCVCVGGVGGVVRSLETRAESLCWSMLGMMGLWEESDPEKSASRRQR